MTISSTLRTLLIAAKKPTPPASWREVREVLAPGYHPDMSFMDVLVILLGAYNELKAEPRFCTGSHARQAFELLMAPIVGYFRVKEINTLEDSLTVEAFYDAMVKHMVSDIRLSRVDWCANELAPASDEGVAHA